MLVNLPFCRDPDPSNYVEMTCIHGCMFFYLQASLMSLESQDGNIPPVLPPDLQHPGTEKLASLITEKVS